MLNFLFAKGGISLSVADIKLVIDPIMEVGDIKSAVTQIQSYFNKMNLSQSLKKDTDGIFKELIGEAENFEKKSKEAFKTTGEVASFEKTAEKINSLFERLNSTMEKLGGENLDKLFKIDDSRITSLNNEIAELQKKISNISSTEIKNVSTAISEMRNVSKSASISTFFDSFKAGDMESASNSLKSLILNVTAFGGSTEETKGKVEALLSSFQTGKIEDISSDFQKLESSLSGNSGKITEYVGALKTLISSFMALSGNGDIHQAKEDIFRLSQEVEQIRGDNVRLLAENFDLAATEIEKSGKEVEDFGRKTTETASRTQSLNNEIQELGNRATYFLSLENSVDLFREGVRKAIEVVKELDAAMTETAVVTDFSVGDMWEKLPEYTQLANELGVSTQGVYEASTLYYQQGLQTEEVMALTTETLKMARIAGLECADATDLMTAA